MEFVRVTAYNLLNEKVNREERIVFEGFLDPNLRIMEPDDWMAKIQSGTILWPVILRLNGDLFRGGTEATYRKSTIRSTFIDEGEEFKVLPSDEKRRRNARIYRIATVKFFEHPSRRDVSPDVRAEFLRHHGLSKFGQSTDPSRF